MHKNAKKKMHLTHDLTVQSRGTLEGTFDGAPKDAHLRKDAQIGTCKVALQGALEVTFELYLQMHLLVQ